MKYQNLSLASAILVLATLACGGSGSSGGDTNVSTQPSSAVQVIETDHRTNTTTTPFNFDNCGVKGDNSQQSSDYTEEFTVDIDLTPGATVDLAVAKASVTAKYAESKKTSMHYHFDWPPGKKQQVTITWTWDEWAGDLLAGSKQGQFVARLPIKYDQVAVDLPCPVMDISKVWLTPFNDLSYYVTQDQARVKWLIQQNGVSGTATIEDKTVAFDVAGEKVVYEVGVANSEENPTVLYTTHPKYVGVILFRTCDDFEKFVANVGNMITEPLRTQIYTAVKNLPNPTCPNILQ